MADASSRDEILARVAAATDGVRSASPDLTFGSLERGYRAIGELPDSARLARLAGRLADYGVSVQRVNEAGLPGAIAGELRRHRARRLVVPDGLPAQWLAGSDGVERVKDAAPATDLDRTDGVLTGCAVAIAETGTIVLDGGPGQGRRAATLVPDLHLCVIGASQVVELVPEAVTRLDAAVQSGRSLTWISGPSATSDIELIRVAGVHGPRTLVVMLVEDR